MNKKIGIILISFLILTVVFSGNCIAGGDNNQNTNGEDGNYEENNNNPYDDDDFPGENDQGRNGVVWP